MTSSHAVFEAAIRINASDKISFESQKKRKSMQITEIFLHKHPYRRSFRHRIHSLLRRADPEEALTSFTKYDAYR